MYPFYDPLSRRPRSLHEYLSRMPPLPAASNGARHPLRRLRETRGLSQNELARALGITRSHVQRLEAKPPEHFSLAELEPLARVFGLILEDFLFHFAPALDGGLVRGTISKPPYAGAQAEGVTFGLFAGSGENPAPGLITLGPKKMLGKQQAPRAEVVWGFVLEGEVLLTLGRSEAFFRRGDFFRLKAYRVYELFNPHALQETRILTLAQGL